MLWHIAGVRCFNDPRAAMQPGNKPVWLQANERGETYAPFRLNIKDSKITWMGGLPHSRASQVDAYNDGKHNQWLTAKDPAIFCGYELNAKKKATGNVLAG